MGNNNNNDDFDDLFDDDFGDFGDDDFGRNDDDIFADLDSGDDGFGLGDDNDDFGLDDDAFDLSELDDDDDLTDLRSDFNSFNGDDDFSFDDDGFDQGGLDDDLGLDDLDEFGDDFITEDEPQGDGPNRTFVILAALMIVLFLIGLGVVIFLALDRGDEITDFDLTVTERIAFNATQNAFLLQTQTQAVINEGTGTALAVLGGTATAEAEVALTDDALTAVQQGTDTALSLAQTGTAEAEQAAQQMTQQARQTERARQTEIAELTAAAQPGQQDTPEPAVTNPPLDTGAIQMTATAIAAALQTPVVETVVPGGGPGGDGQVTNIPTALPDSGLFDDVAGGNDMGIVMLVAFGLIGVIFGARRLRYLNNR